MKSKHSYHEQLALDCARDALKVTYVVANVGTILREVAEDAARRAIGRMLTEIAVYRAGMVGLAAMNLAGEPLPDDWKPALLLTVDAIENGQTSLADIVEPAIKLMEVA
ncbi:hypothetical protein ACODYM_28870 [Burkholderia gladioli]|uniref:hypothetical protein n=1 Tax=Burkholderia gladioli TaxID=28095 RepID=UPI003B50EEE4